ncbi:hypothetical protein IHE44_0009481 [Lamprotornis superbus]|uniref:Uncharacterized protein n=1 Tax=Lamprotornis superbus TaxID=245042 RepID=A0A835U2U1_9PASS|nr:hypothetical protein IHE44_0009481 [Lamprotornis superbus]
MRGYRKLLSVILEISMIQTVRWHIELQPWASPTPSLNYEASRFLKYISTSQRELYELYQLSIDCCALALVLERVQHSPALCLPFPEWIWRKKVEWDVVAWGSVLCSQWELEYLRFSGWVSYRWPLELCWSRQSGFCATRHSLCSRVMQGVMLHPVQAKAPCLF